MTPPILPEAGSSLFLILGRPTTKIKYRSILESHPPKSFRSANRESLFILSVHPSSISFLTRSFHSKACFSIQKGKELKCKTRILFEKDKISKNTAITIFLLRPQVDLTASFEFTQNEIKINCPFQLDPKSNQIALMKNWDSDCNKNFFAISKQKMHET